MTCIFIGAMLLLGSMGIMTEMRETPQVRHVQMQRDIYHKVLCVKSCKWRGAHVRHEAKQFDIVKPLVKTKQVKPRATPRRQSKGYTDQSNRYYNKQYEGEYDK